MARSTFKVLFYVNGSKEKNGIVPIMGRVTINGTVAQFSCKQSVPKTLWDVKGNKAKGKSREARDINLALDNIKAQIIKHYQRISDREAYVTAEMVRNAYQGIGSEYETLIKAFDKDCANFLKRVGKDRSIGTYKVMVRARNYVAAFIKSFYKRNDMSMLELTPEFIKEFAAYLTAERGLKNATIWLNCMWLKGVVMRAHYNGLIPRNPFAQFHISPNVKEREYLTEDEIKTVMMHEFESPTLTLVRDLFIFACFTALSFVDMKELTTDEIVEVNGEKWIIGKRHKTDVPFQVKLLDIPLQIIERHKNRSDGKSVFGEINYWTMCKQLKKVIKECGIEKSISYHSARHTFGTLIQAATGDIETTKKLMGHKSLKSTAVYADVLTEEKVKAISNTKTVFRSRKPHTENKKIPRTKRTAATNTHPRKVIDIQDNE